MNREDRDIQSYIGRIKPFIRFFYRAAFAVTADRQTAEYALSAALTNAYLRGSAAGGASGFRDSVLTVVREEALRRAAETPGENSWDGLTPAEPQTRDRINELLLRESLPVQRMMVLRYGCALTVREIARLVGLAPEHVQQALDRCRLHIERVLAAEKLPAHPFDKLAVRSVRRSMNLERENQIDAAALLADFERELKGRHASGRLVLRIIRAVLLTAVALLCAGLAWLIAVLLEM